jgi:hypothetical protein
VNFVGYVPLRRGLLSHIQDGRLTNNEALTFVVLLMLADKETGSGTINSPTLRSFMPGLSHDAAKRALLGLEEKRYIFRQITPFSKRVYRFWVNLYMPTTGPHKSLQINLSQVFESGDINDIRYVDPAPEGAPQPPPQTAPQGAHHYKKEKETDKENIAYTDSPVCASTVDAVSDSVSHSGQRTKRSTLGQACALHDAQQCAPPDATHSTTHTMHHSMQQDTTHSVQRVIAALPASPEDVGLKWCGYEGAYVDIASGRALSFQESERLLGKRGLTQ